MISIAYKITLLLETKKTDTLMTVYNKNNHHFGFKKY